MFDRCILQLKRIGMNTNKNDHSHCGIKVNDKNAKIMKSNFAQNQQTKIVKQQTTIKHWKLKRIKKTRFRFDPSLSSEVETQI